MKANPATPGTQRSSRDIARWLHFPRRPGPGRTQSWHDRVFALRIAERERKAAERAARPAKLRGDRLIRWCTVLAVAAVAGVAAYISYWHAVEVVTHHGELAVRGHLYPVVIDGVIVAASMVVLDAARHAEDAPKVAWALLSSGIGVTLAANVAAGVNYGLAGAIWSAWPALAFVGCFELLMMLVRAAARRADAGQIVKTPGAPLLPEAAIPTAAGGTGTGLPPAPDRGEPRRVESPRAASRPPVPAAHDSEKAWTDGLVAAGLPLPSYRSWSHEKTGMHRSAASKRAYDRAREQLAAVNGGSSHD